MLQNAFSPVYESDRLLLPLFTSTKSCITPLGIHNVGSYGTRGMVKAADGIYESPLGFIADYNRTGWSNGFGGDYFVNDFPIEGIGEESLRMSVTFIINTDSIISISGFTSLIYWPLSMATLWQDGFSHIWSIMRRKLSTWQVSKLCIPFARQPSDMYIN